MTAAIGPCRKGHRPSAAVAALACLVWLWLSGAAFAHASLVETSPADGAVLTRAPTAFSMTFSEPVSPLVLGLIGPDGSSVGLDRFALHDRTLEIEAPPDLAPGTHVLNWRVISEDGHPVGGAVVFSIGAPSTAPPETASEIDWPVRAAVWLARIALYLGLFLGIGGAFAVTWLGGAGRDGAAASRALLVAGLAGAALSVGFQGLDALGVPLGHVTDAAVWRTGMATSFGRTAAVAVLASLSAMLALSANGVRARSLSLLALAGTGLSLALSGHAGAAEPQWLTRPMVFLHGAAIVFWAGALIPLGLALGRRGPASAGMLGRFSRTIPLPVAMLVVSGIVLAVIQVQRPSALLDTAYGQVLLVKLALLVLLFTLASFNRWRLTGPAGRGDPSATRHLARSIAAETVVVVLIFGVAAAWRFTPPPRALAIAAAQPAIVHIHTAAAMAYVQLSPGRAGPAAASIDLMTGDLAPLRAREVTLVLSNPSSGIEAIRRPARKAGDASWRVDALVIPLPGNWRIRVDVLVSDFELVKLEGRADIRP